MERRCWNSQSDGFPLRIVGQYLREEPCTGAYFQHEEWEDLWEFDDEEVEGDPSSDADKAGIHVPSSAGLPALDAGGYLPRVAQTCPAFVSDMCDAALLYTGKVKLRGGARRSSINPGGSVKYISINEMRQCTVTCFRGPTVCCLTS
jgi:hypothetical protein